jgi:hypothetical protein
LREHSDQILAASGFSPKDIAALRERNIIR